ncbi:DNA sulfur modification protein DndB [Nonomuraea sp. ATR24]|uniref:DNA sulfur modification protein DndB n=1 Tax=Nonomuraea sp. ATR24 TaxID=1676744 RepID=UPI0035C09E2F
MNDLIRAWEEARRRSLSASREASSAYMRRESHSMRQGYPESTLLRRSLDQEDWKPRLAPLHNVDWSRTNPDWEGSAIIGGHVSKNHQNVVLTVNYLRH